MQHLLPGTTQRMAGSSRDMQALAALLMAGQGVPALALAADTVEDPSNALANISTAAAAPALGVLGAMMAGDTSIPADMITHAGVVKATGGDPRDSLYLRELYRQYARQNPNLSPQELAAQAHRLGMRRVGIGAGIGTLLGGLYVADKISKRNAREA